MYAKETDFWLYDKPVRLDWKPSSTQFTFKDHNWANLTNCDFNSYLVITRMIDKQSLGVCDHEITQIMQFSKTSF